MRMRNTSWDTVVDPGDVSASYTNFIGIFSSKYDKHFPVVTERVKLINGKHKPWITTAILKSVRRKKLLYENWLNSKCDYRLGSIKHTKIK